MTTPFVRSGMGQIRLYLDSAVIAEYDELLPTSLFFGVTTNPLRLHDAGVACTVDALGTLVHAAHAHGVHEVHLQTWGNTAEAMIEHGIALSQLGPRVVVKVPITRAGVAALRKLRAREIATTFTGLFAAHQAVTAAVIGAEYAAPYLGRIADTGRDALAEVIAMQAIVEQHAEHTRILVASIRDIAHVATLAAAGLDTFTLDAAVARTLFSDEHTLAAEAAFEAAAASNAG